MTSEKPINPATKANNISFTPLFFKLLYYIFLMSLISFANFSAFNPIII